jgi:UDP-2,3-diacylglucosamine hydrolase
MEKPAYFVSDAHFGVGLPADEARRRNLFFKFLAEVRAQAGHLYILGDLFDFWFEYRSVIFKKHFSILHELAKVIEAGVPITYLAGNHDFHLATFLTADLHFTTSADPLVVTAQGRTLFLAHGDGMIKKDRGYLFLKRFLRFPLNIRLFQLLHPDLGSALALRTSRVSRRYLSKEKKFDFRAETIDLAREKFSQGIDAVVCAHSHKPFIEHVDSRHTVVNTGDWIKNYSYVVLQDGNFELKFWPGSTDEHE